MSLENDQKQCLEKLVWAIDQLGIKVEPNKLSDIANLIVQTMTGPWRYFHTPEHIFEVGGNEDAIEVLAALFHDVVYVQVDKSVNFNLSYYISPFIRQVGEDLLILDRDKLPKDGMLEMVLDLFAFQAGQKLAPMTGQNEFLSALVAAKVYEDFLSPGLILQIIACIEATIPFRSKTPEGLSSSEVLYKRLREVNEKYQTRLTEEEMVETVYRSVRMSNRDVGSFAYESAARFLDGTWNLLPETNHHLKNSNSYTVSQYRTALQKMEGFMNFLKPEIIFHNFRNVPEPQEYQLLIERSQRNMDVGRLYLGTKLLSIAFLEALSLQFGKNIPISTMMGEMRTEGSVGVVLEELLPPVTNPHQPGNELEKEVLTLLEKGRIKDSSYDLKNSPLSTFMVKSMGFDQIRELTLQAKAFFKGELKASDFLALFPSDVLQIVIEKLLELFEARKTALRAALPEAEVLSVS